MKTWNSRWASSNSRPFLMPFQAISWTVLTSWPIKSRSNLQSRHSSRSSFTSSRCQQFLLCRLDEADDLLPSNGRKASEKLINGFAPFEIVHKVLHRNPGSGENRSAPHNLRIGVKYFGQVELNHA